MKLDKFVKKVSEAEGKDCGLCGKGVRHPHTQVRGEDGEGIVCDKCRKPIHVGQGYSMDVSHMHDKNYEFDPHESAYLHYKCGPLHFKFQGKQ